MSHVSHQRVRTAPGKGFDKPRAPDKENAQPAKSALKSTRNPYDYQTPTKQAKQPAGKSAAGTASRKPSTPKPKFAVKFPDFAGLDKKKRPTSAPTSAPAKQPATKEVSCLSDAEGHGRFRDPNGLYNALDFEVPGTQIPEQYHVSKRERRAPGGPPGALKKVFPTHEPSSRSEAVLLEECFDKMLQDAGGKDGDPDRVRAVCQQVMNEVVRQVTVHCVERGRLLVNVWGTFAGVAEQQEKDTRTKLEASERALAHAEEVNDTHHETLERETGQLEQDYQKIYEANQIMSDELTFVREQVEPLLEDQALFRQQTLQKHEMLKSFAQVRQIFLRLARYCDFIDSNDFARFGKDDFARIQRALDAQDAADCERTGRTGPGFAPDAQELAVWRRNVEFLWGYCEQQHVALVSKDYQVAQNEDRVHSLDIKLREAQRLRSQIDFDDMAVQTDDVAPGGDPDAPASGEPAMVRGLPAAWGKQFAKTRSPSGSSYTARTLLKQIRTIYTEKIVADAADDREHNPRDTLPEFVYEWYTHKYGLRAIAEQHIVDLLDNVKRQRKEHPRIRVFAQFSDVADPRLTLPDLNFYLRAWKLIQDSPTGLSFEESADGTQLVDLPRATEVTQKLLAAASASSMRNIIAKVQDLARTISREEAPKYSRAARISKKRSSTPTSSKPSVPKSKAVVNAEVHLAVVDQDELLDLLMQCWKKESDSAVAYLEGLFQAADVNGNDSLDYDEFVSLLRFADPTITERAAVRIFREAVQRSGRESLDLATFLTVAKENNLGSAVKSAGAAGAAGPGSAANPADGFAYLDKSWSTAKGKVEHEIKQLNELGTASARKGADLLLTRTENFVRLLDRRKDYDAAWTAYRMLMSEVTLSRKRRAGSE